MIKLDKILIPTDFSDFSQQALQYGLSFCREYKAKMVLLHVIEDPFYPSTGGSFGFDMADFQGPAHASSPSRTGLAHVLMGSVTEKVVRKAPCPVLVVRKSQHEFIMP